MSRTPALFTPLQLRGVVFSNRILLSPMCQYAAHQGHVQAWHLAHYGRMSLGGMGGAIIESTAICPRGRISPACLGLWQDSQIAGFGDIVGLFKAQAMPVGVQLNHAGRKASTAAPWQGGSWLRAAGGLAWQSQSPSAIAYGEGWPEPQALSGAEVAALPALFAAAAQRAVAAGVDFIELQAAHGYLLHSFLSPLANRRQDEWGGSPARRRALPLAVIRALRQLMPASMPLFLRISSIDRVAGGISLADSLDLLAALKAAGVDLVDASAGGIAPGTNGAISAEALAEQRAAAHLLRQSGILPVMAVGGIADPLLAQALIAQGGADLVALASEMIRDSSFARRAAYVLGREDPDFVLPERYAFYLQFRGGL